MDLTRSDASTELVQVAARLVVDDGLAFAAAKRQAIRQLGLPARTALPDNAAVDAAVREHIAIFCADTQPAELLALRELALVWMGRLAAFNPHLGGAVWHGTATRHSDIHLYLFCEDPKSAEWALIDQRVDYRAGEVPGWRGEPVPALTLRCRAEALDQWVMLHLLVHDLDDLRGALKADAQGRKPRGHAQALRALMSVAVDAPEAGQ
ncbi:hypothetical protein [Hydrogenophaga sp.]|uniref:hypothetical protein n=1 Tax=Hydrogenophaga sp. TaxID=1904254 RepID=UPI0025B7F78A|nr:hypothetical protein [Hydrogenophaga sp.]